MYLLFFKQGRKLSVPFLQPQEWFLFCPYSTERGVQAAFSFGLLYTCGERCRTVELLISSMVLFPQSASPGWRFKQQVTLLPLETTTSSKDLEEYPTHICWNTAIGHHLRLGVHLGFAWSLFLTGWFLEMTTKAEGRDFSRVKEKKLFLKIWPNLLLLKDVHELGDFPMSCGAKGQVPQALGRERNVC